RWKDVRRGVLPMAVQALATRAPDELLLSGSDATATMPVAFGYSGDYTATVHGLRKPFLDANGEVPRGFVDDDASNNFSFRFDNGVSAHQITVPANQLYMRVALFDEFTDGDDDLDLFLFYCPDNQCTQIAESGGFTSDEQIDVIFPDAGTYLVLVHGFQTDQVTGGPGANYSLFTWSVGTNDFVGNFDVTAPLAVNAGDRLSFDLDWAGLDPATRYLGAVAHSTPAGLYGLTIVNVESP